MAGSRPAATATTSPLRGRVRFQGGHCLRPHSGDLRVGLVAENGPGVAPVDRLGGDQPLGLGIDADGDAVHGSRCSQPERQPGREIAADRCLTEEHHLGIYLFDDLFHDCYEGLGLVVSEQRVIDHVNLVRPGRDRLRGKSRNAGSGEDGR